MRKLLWNLSLIFFIVLSLQGCNAVGNYTEHMKHTSSLRFFVSEEAKLERWTNSCKSIGVTEESENWETCLMQAKQLDEQAASARSAAARANQNH